MVRKKPAKGRKAAAPMMPLYDPPRDVGTLSVQEALQGATSWSNSNNIHKKKAVGTLTTATYE